MASKGLVYTAKEVPPRIELKLGSDGQSIVKYRLVKDRIVYNTIAFTSTATSNNFFTGAPSSTVGQDAYEKAKTLFSIPNAAVILGAAAYCRRALTNAEWQGLFWGTEYSMQLQLGGEFITVDKGPLAHIAGGAQFQPYLIVDTGNAISKAYNNAFSDFRWYAVPENKTVPPGENFQCNTTSQTSGTQNVGSLTANADVTLALYALEYKPG